MARERANERACDAAIRRTLAYRAIFNYPLSFFQLYTQLVSQKPFKFNFFQKELNKLVKKGYIGYKNGKYYDKRVKPVNWDLRLKTSEKNYKKIAPCIKILSNIPWIEMLCVTGSTAAYNADKDADIDIFIVAKTHRLWLTRLFVVLFLKLMGLYVKKDADPGKICPNLYIDDSALEWPKDQRSVFTAHEIILMQPLINNNDTYFKFINANSWIKEYFCNWQTIEKNKNNSKKEKIRTSRLLNLFEKITMFTQLQYMKRKRTKEITDKHMIHFRKNDNAGWILERYTKLK